MFNLECSRFGLNEMLGGEFMFLPAGARERDGLRVMVSGFVIIAKGRKRRTAESR